MPMLKIAWRDKPKYPLGIQDSAFAVFDGLIILAGGLTRHPNEQVWRRLADIPDSSRFNTTAAAAAGAICAFDTRTGRIGTAAPLVDRTSFPKAAITGNVVYAHGVEESSRLWHPATFQIDAIHPIKGY